MKLLPAWSAPASSRATHAPILMAYSDARLLRLTKRGPDSVSVEETDHFRLMREFWGGPREFVEAMLEE